MKGLKKLLILFYTTFSISITTNGGYAITAVMKDKFVNKYKWLKEDEMMDLISLGQSIPGPIAVNTSILVGYKISGLLGAFITLFGTILPPLLIMSFISIFYDKVINNEYVKMFIVGMQAGVVALIFSIFIDMFININKKKELLYSLVAIFSFLFIEFLDFSLFYLVLFCIIVGFLKVKLVVKGGKK